MTQRVQQQRRGCYGLRFSGIPGAAPYMQEEQESAPTVRVVRRAVAVAPRAPEFLDADAALLHLSDGTSIARLDRATFSVDLALTRPYRDEEILHPLLSSSVAVFSRWLGRDSFHGAAFVLGGGAWAMVGDKGHGKSTMVGFLAQNGAEIVTDDLIVEENGRLFGGPSFVDLRPDAAVGLGAGRDIGHVGARTRARLDVMPAPASVPLAGWISLQWGDAIELEPLSVEERMTMLFGNRALWRPPVDPASFLRHAALPGYVLRRPKRWDSLPEVFQTLQDELVS